MQNAIENITERGVLVMPLIALWTGRRHLSREELGVDLPKGMTPGSKPIYPPELIKPLDTIKSKLCTAIEKVTVQYAKSIRLLDEKELPALKAKEDELRKEFEATCDRVFSEPTYSREFDRWLEDWEPKWRPTIRSAKIPAADARSRCRFHVSYLRVNAPEDHPHANDEILSGLRGRTWTEFSEMAEAATKGLMGKERVTQKGKSPFRRIAEKARAVSFIDPQARKLAAYIEQVLDELPRTGPIEGTSLTTLQVLVHNLTDPEKAVSLAKAFTARPAEDLFNEEGSDGEDEGSAREVADGGVIAVPLDQLRMPAKGFF